jgi:DNA-damage-inducible protein J
VKAVLRERRIPFEIKQDDPFFDAVNQAYVLKSVKELRDGKGTPHDLIEADDE